MTVMPRREGSRRDGGDQSVRVVGVRPPPSSRLWNDGRLRFADAGSVPLVPGEWVVVHEHGVEWVGQVVVAPDQVVEASPLGSPARVSRLASEAERPSATADGAGRTLLRSLDLPTSAAESSSPPAAPVTEDERGEE